MLKYDNEYATFKQWKDLGGHIRKGEKAEFIVFYKPLPIKEKDKDGNEVEKIIPYLKYINVFHISQVEGVEPLPQQEHEHVEPIEKAEQILNNYITREGITFETSISNRAYYSPDRDLIHIPLIEQFISAAEYYSTAYHEAVHSTGHSSRLARLTSGLNAVHFEKESYSKEELIAELGSASIMNLLGLETSGTIRNSAAYIQNWLEVLERDNRFIVSASSKAEKAVTYILGDKVYASRGES